MSDSRVSKGDRVRRRATGEFGVVVDVEGDFAQIVFAQTGPATLHVDDVEPAAADSTPGSSQRGGIRSELVEFD